MNEFKNIINIDIDCYLLFNNREILTSLLTVNKELHSIVENCFADMNKTITNCCPFLITQYSDKEKTILKPIQLFMRLVNRLHHEGTRVGSALTISLNIANSEKLYWACNNYFSHINNVVRKRDNENDFNIFVSAVAKSIKKTIPEEINSRQFWNGFQKNELGSIESLTMFRSKLSGIPREIAQLCNLRGLYLSGNSIEELPEELFSLTGLTILKLNNNRLKEIPEHLGKLSNLCVLDLGANYIEELPSSINKITTLQKLHLNTNPIKSSYIVQSELYKRPDIAIYFDTK